jgi:hypothetical protein
MMRLRECDEGFHWERVVWIFLKKAMPEVGSQEPEVSSQEPEVRSQESDSRCWLVCGGDYRQSGSEELWPPG